MIRVACVVIAVSFVNSISLSEKVKSVHLGKRAAPILQFEGCFSDTSANSLSSGKRFHKTANLNNECVDQCAEAGYAVASTRRRGCYCTNELPLPRLYAANEPEASGTDGPCRTTCPGAAIAGTSTPCQGAECCGGIGSSAYSVYLSGEIDALKQLLRRATKAYFDEKGLQKSTAQCPYHGSDKAKKSLCSIVGVADNSLKYTVYAIARSVSSEGIHEVKNCTLSTLPLTRTERYECKDIPETSSSYRQLQMKVVKIDRQLETEESITEELATDYDIVNDNRHGATDKTVAKTYAVSTSFDESWSTQHGLDITTTVGAEFEAGALFNKAKTTFGLSVSNSFTSGYSKSKGQSVTESFYVRTTAAPGTKVETLFFKSFQPVQVKWRADIFAHGYLYERVTPRATTTRKNVVEILPYDDRKLFAFGTIDYGNRKKMIARSYTYDANGNQIGGAQEDKHDVE